MVGEMEEPLLNMLKTVDHRLVLPLVLLVILAVCRPAQAGWFGGGSSDSVDDHDHSHEIEISEGLFRSSL